MVSLICAHTLDAQIFLQRFMLEKTAVINVFNSLKFKGKTTESSKMYKFVISQHSYTSLILYSCDYAAICILRCRKTVLKFRPFWNNFDEIIFDFVLSRVLQSGFEKKVFQEFCFFCWTRETDSEADVSDVIIIVTLATCHRVSQYLLPHYLLLTNACLIQHRKLKLGLFSYNIILHHLILLWKK